MKEVDPCAGAVRAGNRHGPDVTRPVLAATGGSKALSRAEPTPPLAAHAITRPVLPMSGRPFLWTRQKAGRLSGWRICSGSTRLMDAHPILNGSLKDIDVDDCEVSELDAIARNTDLAVGVRAIGEPQPASGKFRKDVCVQPPEVGLLGPGLTGEVRLDLLRYIHLAPHASNELCHAGSA